MFLNDFHFYYNFKININLLAPDSEEIKHKFKKISEPGVGLRNSGLRVGSGLRTSGSGSQNRKLFGALSLVLGMISRSPELNSGLRAPKTRLRLDFDYKYNPEFRSPELNSGLRVKIFKNKSRSPELNSCLHIFDINVFE